MITYAMIGAAGYVAPKHMKAIHDTGGELITAVDPFDSVGILDSYFPKCQFTTDHSEFHTLVRSGPIDYVVVCTPNEYHEFYAKWGLSVSQKGVICEKPLTLDVQSAARLGRTEIQYGRPINTILQLRNAHDYDIGDVKHIDIHYHTPRGPWYHKSWKGNFDMSGGLLMNLGIHLFDWVLWKIPGDIYDLKVVYYSRDRAVGSFYVNNTAVTWHLSCNNSGDARRDFYIDGQRYDFNHSFTDMHTEAYKAIHRGEGWTVDDTKRSIALVKAYHKILPTLVLTGEKEYENYDN